jgi:hypothetical protein
MLPRPFYGQFSQDAEQIKLGALFHISPGGITIMILALNTLVEALECLLDTHGLSTVWIIKHHTHRFVAGVTDNLYSRMFFGYVVAVGSGVAPLDF